MKCSTLKTVINIVFLFFSLSIYAQSANKESGNHPESFSVSILKSGHIVVPVKVNDTTKGSFIFDTGGGIEIVSVGFFNKIKSQSIRKGTFTCFKSDGERVDMNTYLIKNIKIGNLTKDDVIVGVLSLLDEIGIDGILSSKFIESIPVTIDFVNQVMTIETQKSITEISKSGTIVPIFLQKHGRTGLDIFIDVSLNEHIHILSELDTGHGLYPIWINSYYKNLIQESNEKSDTLTIDKMSIKDASRLRLDNQEISLKNNLIYEGLVGTAFFKEGKLTIDIPNERIIYWE